MKACVSCILIRWRLNISTLTVSSWPLLVVYVCFTWWKLLLEYLSCPQEIKKAENNQTHLFWTTGPPHDLQITEVRSDSLVLLWKPPVYQGRDPVSGFYVDIKEAEASEEAWRGINNKATDKTYLKVSRHQSFLPWEIPLDVFESPSNS